MIAQIIIIAISVVIGLTTYELTKKFLLSLPKFIERFYRTKIKRPIRAFKRRKIEKKRIKLQKQVKLKKELTEKKLK